MLLICRDCLLDLDLNGGNGVDRVEETVHCICKFNEKEAVNITSPIELSLKLIKEVFPGHDGDPYDLTVGEISREYEGLVRVSPHTERIHVAYGNKRNPWLCPYM